MHFVERGLDSEMWQQHVSNSYACPAAARKTRQVDKTHSVEDRRRCVTKYHENVRVIVEVKESEFGGRLARQIGRDLHTQGGLRCSMESLESSQPTPSCQQYQALVQRTENTVKDQTSTQAQRGMTEEWARGATGF